MAKIVVGIDHPVADDKRASLAKMVADALGVLADDVIFVPPGLAVSVIEVPAELIKAREQKDAEDKEEAERKAKEEVEAAGGDDLAAHTVVELHKIADKEEVQLTSDMHKADIIAAIRAKRKAAQPA